MKIELEFSVINKEETGFARLRAYQSYKAEHKFDYDHFRDKLS